MTLTPPLKVMLYSHDSWGLGHIRRSLAIAHALNRHLPGSSLLVVTGSPQATAFPLAAGIDVLKLPSVTKNLAGQYQARQLNEQFATVMQLRSALLVAAFRQFKPDLLIVDHQLVGLAEEALPLLEEAPSQGTYCVYGMRDVLDSVDATETGWRNPACRWAMQDGFDEIWIYGDEQYFRTADFYPTLHPQKARIVYTGLVTNGKIASLDKPSNRPHVLVTSGGGEDGGPVLLNYLRSMVGRPQHWDSTVVTGPLLRDPDYAQVTALALQVPGVTLHQFHDSIPGLMRSADLVVSMAGYNSCAEIIASKRKAILIPRTQPRREQLIRAQYLDNGGVATCLVDPDPAELYSLTRALLLEPSLQMDFPKTDGLAVIARRCREIALARTSGIGRQAGVQL